MLLEIPRHIQESREQTIGDLLEAYRKNGIAVLDIANKHLDEEETA